MGAVADDISETVVSEARASRNRTDPAAVSSALDIVGLLNHFVPEELDRFDVGSPAWGFNGATVAPPRSLASTPAAGPVRCRTVGACGGGAGRTKLRRRRVSRPVLAVGPGQGFAERFDDACAIGAGSLSAVTIEALTLAALWASTPQHHAWVAAMPSAGRRPQP